MTEEFISMKSFKGKKWKSFDFGPMLKLKNKTNTNIEKSFKTEIIKSNFYHKLKPKSVKDLAVNSRKIKEIEEWLMLTVINQEKKSSFLLLSGPTGTGKTTTLNVLCKKLGISISEWVNPTDKDNELCKGNNQIKRFIEFLTDSKWHSLIETEYSRNITLVKDFPNAVIFNPEEFFNVLCECYKLKFPVVFICTNASSSSINFIKMLFTDNIISKYNITHISFNPCAPSLMKTALKRAHCILKENCNFDKQFLSTTIIDTILTTSMGDLRNAMNLLYLEYLLGTDDLFATNKVLGNGNNKRKECYGMELLRFKSRDENLGLFHGLGRILNPKRKQFSNSWRLNCDIEKLVEEFSVQPILFITLLFENYLKYFGNIYDATKAAYILSFSINFINSWIDKQDTVVLGLWISTLGLMIYNEHKMSKWNQIRGLTKINSFCNKNIETLRLDSTDYFYYNIINNISTSHRFSTCKTQL